MRNGLKDRVFLVTGAAGGVGRAVVDQLIAQGAKVAATDIAETVHDLVKEFPAAALATVAGDVSKSADVERMFATAEAKFGPVESLISNAAFQVLKAIIDFSEEEWDATMAVNVKGFFLCARRALPNMLKAGKGSITATASISSVVGLPALPAYAASKGAVLMMVRQMAVEYAASGIRVNAVGPGGINTPFLRQYFDSLPDHEREAGLKAVRDAHPMKRWAEPDEVAKALIFLASDDASFITGEILMVDGGYTAA